MSNRQHAIYSKSKARRIGQDNSNIYSIPRKSKNILSITYQHITTYTQYQSVCPTNKQTLAGPRFNGAPDLQSSPDLQSDPDFTYQCVVVSRTHSAISTKGTLLHLHDLGEGKCTGNMVLVQLL